MCFCGSPKHEGEPCKNGLKCVNCGENHSPRDRNCRILKQEVQIQNVKVLNKISYAEAKRKVTPRTSPSNPVTYANVTANDNSSKIIKELVPEITKIVIEQVQKTLSDSFQLAATKNIITQNFNRHIDPNDSTNEGSGRTDTSTAMSEKRKRNESYIHYRESDSEDSIPPSATDSTTRTVKKKRGWQKGKPRKEAIDQPKTPTQPPIQITHTQPTCSNQIQNPPG